MATKTEKTEKATEPEARIVVRAKQVDTYCTVRTAVRVTPAVCDLCALDLVQHNASKLEASTYEELPENVQADLAEAIKVHRREAHGVR